MEGQGTLHQSDGVKYRGGFKNGLKEGYGILEDKDGRYEGQFRRGEKVK